MHRNIEKPIRGNYKINFQELIFEFYHSIARRKISDWLLQGYLLKYLYEQIVLDISYYKKNIVNNYKYKIVSFIVKNL